MLFNVISLLRSFTIPYSSISIKKFNRTADPLQLYWPQNCGCYVTNYIESINTVTNIKKKQLLTLLQIFKKNNHVNIERYG